MSDNILGIETWATPNFMLQYENSFMMSYNK